MYKCICLPSDFSGLLVILLIFGVVHLYGWEGVNRCDLGICMSIGMSVSSCSSKVVSLILGW